MHLRTFVSDIHDTALLHGRVCRVGRGLQHLHTGEVWGGWCEPLHTPPASGGAFLRGGNTSGFRF